MPLAALALAALPLALPGDVLDAGTGRTYPTIAAAVLAASDGDTIRIFAGAHGSFAVHGKGLTILAQGSIQLDGTIRVQGLTLGQTVTLDGFEVDGQEDPGLILGLNQGSIRIHDCEFEGPWTAPVWNGPTTNGARIVGCADVAFTDCGFRGGAVAWLDDDDVVVEGGTAIDVIDSTIALHGCAVQGTFGAELSSPGGHGIFARESDLLIQDCDIAGGWGAFGSFSHGPGSPGAAVALISGHANLIATPHNTGSAIREIDLGFGGTLEEHGGGPMALDAPTQVRDDAGQATIVVRGDATDLVILVDGPAAARRDLPGFVGDLLVGGAARRRFLGTGATLTHDLAIPDVPDLSAETLHVQSVHLRVDPASPTGRKVLFGPVKALTVLDAVL